MTWDNQNQRLSSQYCDTVTDAGQQMVLHPDASSVHADGG